MDSKRERLVLRLARDMTAGLPVRIRLNSEGRHPSILLEGDGWRYKMPFARSPRSDVQCQLNVVRQQIGRVLRAHGHA